MQEPLVGVIMGSKSDWETMAHAVETLETLGVPHDAAAPFPGIVRLLDPRQHLPDGEHLLVAGDLAHATVEHGEHSSHLQEAFRPAQPPTPSSSA